MDTIVDKWFSTREQKITWGISLAFFIIFPIYFANIAAFLPGDAMIDSSDSATGAWEVDFTETDVATSESTEFLMDGEEFEFEFMFNDPGNLAYVEVTVSHDETDEDRVAPGPMFNPQCDNAIGEMDMSDVSGYVGSGSTTSGDSGSPNDCPVSYTMVIMLIENYSGDSYETTGSKGEIQDMWTDNGNGRGEWVCKITLETRTADGPGPLGSVIENDGDEGEEITVSWRVVGGDVAVTPIINIDA